MLKIVPSNQFKKDLKLAQKRGLQMERLREVINTLASGQRLADKHRDHGLTGIIAASENVMLSLTGSLYTVLT